MIVKADDAAKETRMARAKGIIPSSQQAACFWLPLERGRGQNRGVGYDEHDRRCEKTVEGSRMVG